MMINTRLGFLAFVSAAYLDNTPVIPCICVKNSEILCASIYINVHYFTSVYIRVHSCTRPFPYLAKAIHLHSRPISQCIS